MRIGVGLAAVAPWALAVWYFAYLFETPHIQESPRHDQDDRQRHRNRSGAPSAPQVEPLLRSYLESTSHCGGTIDIQVDNVSIGPYVSQMGGWPVYAGHVEACRSKVGELDNSSLTMTYDGSHDTKKKIAAAFVRRTMSGQLELYAPAVPDH